MAEWEPDLRLTFDDSSSWVCENNGRCIVSHNNYVHIVWSDFRSQGAEIYCKRSTDYGQSWEADRRLTFDSVAGPSSGMAAIAISGAYLHLVWRDTRDGNREIYYKRSSDNGLTWSNDVRLTNDPGISGLPSITAEDSMVYLVWQDDREGNFEIFFKYSTNWGEDWSDDIRLTNDPGVSAYPTIAVQDSLLHLAWHDNRDGNAEIYYKRSTNWGISWSPDTRLTEDPDLSGLPTIALSGSYVHLCWMDRRDGNGEIYYKWSSDHGLTWSVDRRLTNAPYKSSYPSLVAEGKNLHLAWYDFRDGNAEIYYKNSTDQGVNWSSDLRLTNSSGTSQWPSIALADTMLNLVWMDDRDGNWEIYYKRNPNGNVYLNQERSPKITPLLLRIDNRIEIDGLPSGSRLYLFDPLGRRLNTLQVKNQRAVVPLPYSAGLYLLVIETPISVTNQWIVVIK
ncbi:hypothetical protein DRP53_09805 [candidate division WOR-3 bacterium]|uniref:Sialidase domain-containing protein n=1 Tax=candidate division WOR-3 bacterium TaxID=2052148 RepID=A0A660SDK0_UNCW3|nr:MAG: hypothetical protein DRP53_09805 [candidate division WOR-3 bacterium]